VLHLHGEVVPHAKTTQRALKGKDRGAPEEKGQEALVAAEKIVTDPRIVAEVIEEVAAEVVSGGTEDIIAQSLRTGRAIAIEEEMTRGSVDAIKTTSTKRATDGKLK
jgi:hypothetical protein